jgi:anoctamin-10
LGFFTTVAKRLTDYENHSIDEAYEAAFTRKIFVLNFITSYTPLFLTSFVYVPFAKVIVPHLDILSLTSRELTDEKQTHTHSFEINPNRLKKQVIYFTVTAQAVNLGLEIVLPYVKRRVFKKVEELKDSTPSSPALVGADAEKKFLKRVRDESKLDVYDVTTDLREMVMQFGYLTLFSIIWPFTSVSFIINNWVELRADAIKICVEMQRPVPLRADSIGPWLDSLQFLAWLGSATTSALIYLFSDDANFGPAGSPKPLTIAGVMTAIVLSEHIFFAAKMLVGIGFNAVESVGLLKERRERFLVRKRYLEESMGIEADEIDTDVVTLGDSVTDVAGKSGFWRAGNVAETYGIGAEIIRSKLEKKEQ